MTISWCGQSAGKSRCDPSETTRRAPNGLTDMSKPYLLGVMHDSTERRTTYRISSKQKSYVELLAKMIKNSGHNAWIYREGRHRNMYIVEFSKTLMKNVAIKTKQDKIDYIRGYFDAEGSVPHSPKTRFYIYFAQKNKEDLLQVQRYLNDVGILTGKIHNSSQKVDPDYWRFFIRCQSYHAFIEKIDSWHPIKCQLLRMMI